MKYSAQLSPTTYRASRDDIALARMARLWTSTGVVPVAHIVAELSALDEETSEYEIVHSAQVYASLRRKRMVAALQGAEQVA